MTTQKARRTTVVKGQSKAAQEKPATPKRKSASRPRVAVAEVLAMFETLNTRLEGFDSRLVNVEGAQSSHVQDCTLAYTELRDSITPMVQWHAARLSSERARAQSRERVSSFFVRVLSKGFEEGVGHVVWGTFLIVVAAKVIGVDKIVQALIEHYVY